MLTLKIDDEEIIVLGKGISLVKFRTELADLISMDEISSVEQGGVRIPRKYFHRISDLLKTSTQGVDADSEKYLDSASVDMADHLEAINEIRRIVEAGETYLDDAHWASILTPYQALAVKCITVPGLKGMCIFDEQGTGKTVTAISAFDILVKRDQIDRMIVVSPTTLIGNWAMEIEKFADGFYRTVAVTGDSRKKYELLSSQAQIYLMNYETVLSQETMLRSVAGTMRTLLVADESFMVKNPEARRSMAVEAVRKKCRFGLMLCGTPAPNSSTDVIHQFNVADGGVTFSGFDSSGELEDIRHDIEVRIRQRGAYLRRLKSDVLPELPDKNFKVVQVPLEGEQAVLYREACTALQLELQKLDNEKFLRNLAWYFQRRAALLQLCVNPRLIDPLYKAEPAKHVALDKFVEEYLNAGRKLVIWSVYRSDIDDLEARYARYGVVRVDGSIPSSERAAIVERFQTDSSIRIFVGNPAAAGAGITLHAASVCVYVSFSNQAAHFMQSLDRIHRKGQMAESVEYIFLVGKDTLEERELSALQRKEASQSDLLGDEQIEDSITLAEALEELNIQ